MLRKIANLLVVLPLALIFIVFAVANRHVVTVSFDPFNADAPAAGVSLPLFVVIILVAVFGVIAGSVATWFGQRRWRSAAKRNEIQAQEARAQLATLHDRLAASARDQAMAQRNPAPVGQSLLPSPSFGRDKQGAAL